ncbi:MAG TPA: hypothetical protein DDY21_01120 [Candidatus Moranbacteria bacterium]|nr:hypothetical protein [Candidatus Moranbacteria bacterium]HCO99722.1 hypothetical protein [Candidatus Moranbacteria bacterium]
MGNNKKHIENKKTSSLVSYGDFVLSPVIPGSNVSELCNKIDSFYNSYPKKHIGRKPSDLIKGAFYAIRLECRSNPDWMSQAANSMREVLFPLIGKNVNYNLIKLFNCYATDEKSEGKKFNREFIDTFKNLDIIYRKMSDIAHHGVNLGCLSEKEFVSLDDHSEFEELMQNAINVLNKSFGFQQIYIHNVIDLIIQEKLSGKTKQIKNDLELILKSNVDAQDYFFNKADKNWLKFLHKNGFLDAVKKTVNDKNQYSYTLPELQYLVNISEQDPAGVVNFMLDVPISDENFNPEVINSFAYICSSLPKEQLVRMVLKIRDEKWIQLMKKFNNFGFEYQQMLEKLAEAKDWKNFLILTESVLAVRPKEVASEKETFGMENPFYFRDLGEIEIFKHLTEIDDENLEEALKLVLDVMKKIVPNKKRKSKNEIFEVEDSFGLFDVDFFTLELEDDRHSSYRDDVKNLTAVMKKLIERLFAKNYAEPEKMKRMYAEYAETLPLSRSMWRFSLFVLSLHPQIFQAELKKAFFRFFEENKNGYDLIFGAEYEQALKRGFSVLLNEDKRQFIKNVIEYFGKKREDEKDEFWHKVKGREILSCVFFELDANEKNIAEEKLEGKIAEEFQPEPSIVSNGMAGFISAKAPITLEDLQKFKVSEIVSNLCEIWSPKNLQAMDTEKDFMNPLNAEGMGNLLKQDITQRFEEYIDSAELFFNRDVLDQHYTHSFLQGVYDVLRENKVEKENVDFGKLLILIENIVKSDADENFPEENDRRQEFDAWLVGWKSVFYSMSDVIKELLGEGKTQTTIDFSKHHEQLLFVIKHLLAHQNPGLERNTEEESEPFFVAINSVRGRAFQALVLFVYREGENSSEKEISKEVKEIFEETLEREKTFAIMFLFGHYLPSFYYRDKKWIASLMPKIFSKDGDKFDLYLAAWEGYLSANIYGDMFVQFEDLYERAIQLDSKIYTDRKYFKNIDEGLATHLALAYVHFPDFKIGSKLFEMFWKNQNTTRQKESISFVGRHIVSNANATTIIKESKVDVQKIKDLWDWTLKNVENEEVFAGFGFWVDKEQNVFADSKWLADHIVETLEKSKGETDWDYGLIKSVPILAEQAPQETLRILKAYLLEYCLKKSESFRNMIYVNDFVRAFEILYKNDATKLAVSELINELIEKGGSRFWKLEEIVNG